MPGQPDVSPVQSWYLHIPPAENAAFAALDAQNQPVLADGQTVYDFGGVQDMLLLLEYDYDHILPGT